jgi:hypothetical protein
MQGKELSGDLRVVRTTVGHALRVERAERLAQEELGDASWVEPAKRFAEHIRTKVIAIRRNNK